MTFLAQGSRRRWLNNVVAAVVGRGAWEVGGTAAETRGTEIWDLEVYECVNELDAGKRSRSLRRGRRPPASGAERLPRLEHLFDATFRFGTLEDAHFPTSGDDRDWVGYASGDGAVVGRRLWGSLGWTNMPRRRADRTWLPHVRGFIRTETGVPVLFDFRGLNVSLTSPFEYIHRSIDGTMTFRAADPRYLWLNRIWALAEGEVRQEKTEFWSVRVYALGNRWMSMTRPAALAESRRFVGPAHTIIGKVHR